MEATHPIRIYRLNEGKTAAALARDLDVARNTVWRWETGARGIDRKLWKRISEKTGISVDTLAALRAREAAE